VRSRLGSGAPATIFVLQYEKRPLPVQGSLLFKVRNFDAQQEVQGYDEKAALHDPRRTVPAGSIA